jgi:hypothetical protein
VIICCQLDANEVRSKHLYDTCSSPDASIRSELEVAALSRARCDHCAPSRWEFPQLKYLRRSVPFADRSPPVERVAGILVVARDASRHKVTFEIIARPAVCLLPRLHAPLS